MSGNSCGLFLISFNCRPTHYHISTLSIFGIGSDFYDDTIIIESMSCMSERNQLLCNWSKPHLRGELCSYRLMLHALLIDVNIHLILMAKPKSVMIQEYQKKTCHNQKHVFFSKTIPSTSCKVLNSILSPTSHGT